MKVVLFCGGLGMRLREYTENVPKPMVKIGRRPILWHLMKYYSHFGHDDFILCLGYKGEVIKRFFLNYEESVSNDFVLSQGGEKMQLMSSDIDDWRITFADTGQTTCIGQRLAAVRKYLDGDEVFLANYADGLTDLPLPRQIEHFREHDAVGSFLCVKPYLSYHYIDRDEEGVVQGIHPFRQSDLRVNGGFFVLTQQIFDYMEPGDDLVEPTFQKLIEDRQLLAYDYDGFWQAVDTAKDKERVDQLQEQGCPPWAVWEPKQASEAAAESLGGGNGRPDRGVDMEKPLRSRARYPERRKPRGGEAGAPSGDEPLRGDLD